MRYLLGKYLVTAKMVLDFKSKKFVPLELNKLVVLCKIKQNFE